MKKICSTRFWASAPPSWRGRRSAFPFLLVALVLAALPGSSIASERDRSFETSTDEAPRKSRRTAVTASDLRAINRLIAEINAAEKSDPKRMLSIVIINTNVAGDTLKRQKARHGLSLGEVYVAHSLALASGKSFDQIVASKASGNSWRKIAQVHNVSLQGSTASLKEMMRSKREE